MLHVGNIYQHLPWKPPSLEVNVSHIEHMGKKNTHVHAMTSPSLRFSVFQVGSYGEWHIAHQQQEHDYAQTPQITPEPVTMRQHMRNSYQFIYTKKRQHYSIQPGPVRTELFWTWYVNYFLCMMMYGGVGEWTCACHCRSASTQGGHMAPPSYAALRLCKALGVLQADTISKVKK